MIRRDLIYNKLKELIKLYIDDELVSNYIPSIPATDRSDLFLGYIDSLRHEYYDIQSISSKTEVYKNVDNLCAIFDSISTEFNDYNTISRNNVSAILFICKYILSLSTDDYDDIFFQDNETLNDNPFTLIKVENNIYIDNYLCYDNNNLENMVFLFSFIDIDLFEKYLTDSEVTDIDLLLYILHQFNLQVDYSECKYCLVNNKFKDKISMVLSYIKLRAVSDGYVIHKQHLYKDKPHITSNITFDVSSNYQQFVESIHILSEYNNEEDILSKYLKIYQVLENFMIKTIICGLVEASNPSMFSIKDFKALYSKTEKSELSALKDLIDQVFKINYNSTDSFGKYVHDKWKSIDPSKEGEINEILRRLQVILNDKEKTIFKFSDVSLDNISKFFTRLVYSLRNSIVHNKETEFHLSYFDMPAIILYLFNEFMFACLEEIIFNLMINDNDIVWYQQSAITLYSEQ